MGGLNPEILALIFVRIPADMMVRSVPLVCKPWREAVAGSYCWTDIDVEDWCRRRKDNNSHSVDSVVRKLVRRSKSTFKRLSTYGLGYSGFSFVANCGRCLKVLEIPMSEITDLMVLKHAESLENLTELDISYCLRITSNGIETFGKQCKSLVHLKRNMPPPDWGSVKTDDSEAVGIADTMSGLRGLELGYGRFGDSGLNAILCNCKELNQLDIRGCLRVELIGDLEEKCERLCPLPEPLD